MLLKFLKTYLKNKMYMHGTAKYRQKEKVKSRSMK